MKLKASVVVVESTKLTSVTDYSRRYEITSRPITWDNEIIPSHYPMPTRKLIMIDTLEKD